MFITSVLSVAPHCTNSTLTELKALKNKSQLSKSEDIIGFIEQFMNLATYLLVNRKVFKGLYKIRSFYRKKDEAREILVKV